MLLMFVPFVSLADLIILGWIIFCVITPNFIVIPGTRGAAGYKDYRFHFFGFLKGGGHVIGALPAACGGVRVAITYW